MPNDPIIYADITKLVKDLDEISQLDADQITKNIFEDLGKEIVEGAKQKAPRKTGKLANSITSSVKDGKLTIEVGVPYGMYQEFGTGTRGEFNGKPYTIVPRNAKYLKFKINGKTVYTKKVVHPGIPASPYLRPAALETFDKLFPKLVEQGAAYVVKGPKSAL